MAYNPDNNRSRRQIDGFFRPPSQVPKPGERLGLDSMRGARSENPNRRQNWQPRHVHPTSEPRSKQVSDFFNTLPPNGQSGSGAPNHNTPAHAAATSSAVPAPLRGKYDSQGDEWWRRFIRKPSRKTVKRSALVALAILLIIGGYLFVKFLIASSQIFQGNMFSAIFAQGKELKMDENGRTNILLFGTSEDDPNHGGAELSDSMMMVSLDQEKKKAFMVSVPRDLYVDYGMACNSGYEGKINEVYLCGKSNNNGDEKAGQKAARRVVGEAFGVDMHYSVHVNYTALKKVVNAIGGVEVVIESEDPRGVLDRNFDWQCNYDCYLVKHPNGPVKLDGKRALALARARGSVAPTYGFSGGNFDREMYQRKILVAIKEKAVSAGVLTNPVRVSSLIDAIGDNVRTNFDTSEVVTLVDLAQEIQPDKIRSVSLVDRDNPLVTTGSAGSMSIVQPVAGLYDFSQIHSVIDAYATGDTAYFENATVDVLNASERAGAASERATELEEKGITIANIGNAPTSYADTPIRLYDLPGGDKNPGTLKKLQNVLGVKAINKAPAGVTSSADFVIIIGSNGTP